MILLYNNLIDSATLTASSTATGFPANNLKNPFRTKCWKTAGATAGVANLVIDHGSAKAVNAIALTGYDWAAAPGTLVMEFNSTDSWDTPAATERLTGTAATTPGGNKATVILKLSTTQTYRYNRLRVASSYGVTLASAPTPLYVAHNNDMNFGTGNFTFAWRGSLPDWTPSFTTHLMNKATTSDDGTLLSNTVAGKISIKLLATTYTSTVGHGLTDGTTHEICAVITNKVGAVDGSVVFYVDGVILGASVPITTAYASPNNAGNLGILCNYNDSVMYNGTVEFFARYSTALTAAEVLSLYQNGRIAVADQWGSNTAKQSDTAWTGATGATPPTNWTVGVAGVFTIFDSGDGSPYNACLKIAVNATPLANPRITRLYTGATIGKKYRVEAYFKHGTGTSGNINVGSALNAFDYANWIGLTDATWTKYSVEFTATTTTIALWLRTMGTVAGQYELFDEVKIYEVGAVVVLEPSGIGAASWNDSSNNDHDGVYPASGITVYGLADWSLGRLFVGEYFEPSRDYKRGYQEAVVDPSILSQSIGGQVHADEIERYRTFSASGIMTQAQWVLFQAMINTVGTRKEIFAALDYTNQAAERTIYGRFTQLPSVTQISSTLFEYNFSITEAR